MKYRTSSKCYIQCDVSLPLQLVEAYRSHDYELIGHMTTSSMDAHNGTAKLTGSCHNATTCKVPRMCNEFVKNYAAMSKSLDTAHGLSHIETCRKLSTDMRTPSLVRTLSKELCAVGQLLNIRLWQLLDVSLKPLL